jgi:4-hydroxy-tetrahydrodipicolinate reductase
VTPSSIRVAVSGATGRTGREVARGVAEAGDLRLVAALARRTAGRDMAEFAGPAAAGLKVAAPDPDSLPPADVLVDFSGPETAGPLVAAALERGIACVVGTTGLEPAVVERWRRIAAAAGSSAVVCRNFSMGAMLQARLASLAAALFADVEIVELHGAHKRDRPSGTAAELAAALARDARPVPVHSVRLPGLVAHQEVLFGAPGELLTIRHDVLSREAYVPGVLLAVRRVRDLGGVVERMEEVSPWRQDERRTAP